MEDWEKRAKAVLQDSNTNPATTKPHESETTESEEHTTLAELDALLAEGEEIEAALPSHHALHAAAAHARDWLAKVSFF